MHPEIEKVQFGKITVAGETYDHDLLIRWDGKVRKRKKQLSKAQYGTSHIVSLEEAQHIYAPETTHLIIGTGMIGRVTLSDAAARFFKERQVTVELRVTPKAIKRWNHASGHVVGLFHITC